MHHTIIFLVKSNNEQEALENAKAQLNNLIEHDINFIDSGSFFDEQRMSKSKTKAILKLNTHEGKMQLLRSMHATYRDFLGYVNKVEDLLNKKTKEEIFKDQMDSYYFHKVYEREWVCIDNNFVGIDMLNNFLVEHKLEDIYVIPCDVHT